MSVIWKILVRCFLCDYILTYICHICKIIWSVYYSVSLKIMYNYVKNRSFSNNDTYSEDDSLFFLLFLFVCFPLGICSLLLLLTFLQVPYFSSKLLVLPLYFHSVCSQTNIFFSKYEFPHIDTLPTATPLCRT